MHFFFVSDAAVVEEADGGEGEGDGGEGEGDGGEGEGDGGEGDGDGDGAVGMFLLRRELNAICKHN